MYNPYLTAFSFLIAAFQFLTNPQARRFYADRAIEHTFLTVAIAGISIKRTVEAGQAFRQSYPKGGDLPDSRFYLWQLVTQF